MKLNGIIFNYVCIMLFVCSFFTDTIAAQEVDLAALKQQYDSLSAIGEDLAAIEVGKQWLSVCQQKDTTFAFMAVTIANHCLRVNESDEAVFFSKMALPIVESTYGCESEAYVATKMISVAAFINKKGNWNGKGNWGNLRQEVEEILPLYDRLCGKNKGYFDLLKALASSYGECYDFQNSIGIFKKALEQCEAEFGVNNEIYAGILDGYATYLIDIDDYTQAIDLLTRMLQIYDTLYGKESEAYLKTVSSLSHCYSASGQIEKSNEYINLILDIYKCKGISETLDLALILYDLHFNLQQLGKVNQELLNQALNIFRANLSNLDEFSAFCYTSVLADLASQNSRNYDIVTAVRLRNEAISFMKKHFDYFDINQLLQQYFLLYFDCNQLQNTEDVVSEIDSLIQQSNDISLDNLITYYRHIKVDMDSAIYWQNQKIILIEQEKGKRSNEYYAELSNIGHLLMLKGDYEKSLEYSSLVSSNLDEGNPYYYISQSDIAHVNYCIGKFDKANHDYEKLHELELEYGIDPTNTLWAWAHTKIRLEKYNEAARLYNGYLNLECNKVFINFSNMANSRWGAFWNVRSSSFYSMFPILVCASDATNSEITGELYNKSSLFAKGLLLSAETDLHNLLYALGNQKVKEKVQNLRAVKIWLQKLYLKPESSRHVSTDSLENVAERLETELVQMSKTYGDFMHNLKLTWKDVQAKLGDKDVAVEFLSFPVLNSDSTMYIALTVRKGYDAPHMVRLFEENELKSIKSSYYKSPELGKLVWGKMADELDGVKNIYFSPSGELYNIAIESMPHWADSCMMSDRFNLYRLSSTRELAINRSETKSSGAVVYGGIQYDADVAEMGTPKSESDALYAYRGFDADSTNCRGTNWQFLSGTMVEAEKVDSILTASKTDVTTLSGNQATETTFKNLSGQKKNLLHIATHGFYWSESAAERKKAMEKLSFLQTGDDRPRYVEDKAMTRSGLLFAGANNTFNEVEIPAGVDDGVLTAQEISQLDLRGLDLLVLSACQTGLGEIKGDGVFGLQRGFKKAGAQTIMMSLWEVSDEATKDLMTQFYTALTSGKSKREAFKQAQQYVKEHDADYGYRPSNLRNKRPHWAAFILLDAIE